MPAPLGNKNRLTHGMDSTPEYGAYYTARNRCTNPKHPKYHLYGGRGIKFMFASFSAFLLAVGLKPSPNHVLDRRNNDGHYEAGNVRWVTHPVSLRNRRRWAKH